MNSVMAPVEKLPEIPSLRAANDGAGIPRAIRPDGNPSVRTKSFLKCRMFEGERPPARSHENTCNLQGCEKFDYLSPSSLMHFCNQSFLHFALLVISRRVTTLLFAVVFRFRWGMRATGKTFCALRTRTLCAMASYNVIDQISVVQHRARPDILRNLMCRCGLNYLRLLSFEIKEENEWRHLLWGMKSVKFCFSKRTRYIYINKRET